MKRRSEYWFGWRNWKHSPRPSSSTTPRPALALVQKDANVSDCEKFWT